jgi:predicted O-methyltransferase YrrM
VTATFNDYDVARAEMRAEPGFYPMASEPETGEFIAALIRMMCPRTVLELGTHRGHTTLYLVQAMEGKPGSVTTLDFYDHRSPALRRFDDRYTFILGDDLAAVPALTQKFDLIYLDTCHKYEHTRAELAMLRMHQPEAILVLHDPVSHPGVARAIAGESAHYDAVVLPTPLLDASRMNGLALLAPKHLRSLRTQAGVII